MTVRAAYIFHNDGLAILSTAIDAVNFDPKKSLIFAGLSSAINTLMKDLGHEDLLSIQVRNGKLIYSVNRDSKIVFVIHALDEEAEIIGQFLVKQIEFEFLSDFKELLERNSRGLIDQREFVNFKAKIKEIYHDLKAIYHKEPNLLRFFPTNIPLSLIHQAKELEDNLTAGFPDNTIRLARALYRDYQSHPMKQEILFSLGKFFGHELLKTKFKEISKISDQKDLLQVLKEVSIASYDRKKQQFILEICPICRGMQAEQPICDFFSGFIEGGFNNPNIKVYEITCKASGDSNCIFQIESIWK